MTETVLRFSGIALIGVFVSLLLKERYRAQGTVAVIVAVILISLKTVEEGVESAVSTVTAFADGTGLSEYVIVLQKALGIGYITTISANICKDANESTLASTLEFAGKVQLLLLSLPLVSSLLETARGLL